MSLSVLNACLPELHPLQSLVLPQMGLAPDEKLFFKRSGAVGFSLTDQEFSLQAGASLAFETWFNMFNLDLWRRAAIGDLYLQIQGRGQFELTLHSTRRGHSTDTLYQEVLCVDGDRTLAQSEVLERGTAGGVLSISVTCLSAKGTLRNLVFATDHPPRNQVDATIAITTFQRPVEVARSVAKLASWRLNSRHRSRIVVVDNGGGAAGLAQNDVTVLACENIGGSGGFARGLAAAQDADASHCVFIDDDADLHPESLERALAYLAYAPDPATALCGAMIAQENRSEIWENGASFFQFCAPFHGGTDLTSRSKSAEIMALSTEISPKHTYGGWWFFAFPIQHARHLPYPFFLRGDDVSFCLANRFAIHRLNGVAAYQEGFTSKESPRTWYLDLRSHLAHHLSHPDLEISALAMLKIALFFVGQTVLRMHYGSARAVLLGLRDVMRGPEFFAQNTRLQARLAQVDALARSEAWEPIDAMPKAQKTRSRIGACWIFFGNGLLLPGFRWWGRKAIIRAQDRRELGYIWGCSNVIVLHNSKPLAYRLRHSKTGALEIGLVFLGLALRFLLTYRGLRRRYQSSYGPLTTRAFWDRVFDGEKVQT